MHHHQKQAPPPLPVRPLQQGRVTLTSAILTFEQKSTTNKVRFAADCADRTNDSISTTTSSSSAGATTCTTGATVAQQQVQQVHMRHTSMPATAALLHKFYSNGSSSSDTELQTVTFTDVSGVRSPTVGPTVDKRPTVKTGSPPQQFTVPTWKSFTNLVGMLIQAPSQQQR
jgi:hypothetical protein